MMALVVGNKIKSSMHSDADCTFMSYCVTCDGMASNIKFNKLYDADASQ